MTIEEVKDYKKAAEEMILENLRAFELLTGTTVHNIDVRHTYEKPSLVSVTLITRID